ncbi:hypothetical protein OESDEN_14709 [Oesophagostomum dentatum]|uniref:RanBD1 domain-containing protein n=1 Tax=Oesophagostomum dentatum TaxID=61180 RepID=A0A0B1SQT1_OESDE|nr:hypothetical protein OESDEN_14709 [Oesophagostomum dentatum]
MVERVTDFTAAVKVVFTACVKLFRFVKETKENREHGVGDLRILRNPKINCRLIVMNSEQVREDQSHLNA